MTINIVSGLPRSGTSMMMRMLEAGGMPVLIDGVRAADADNPKGYYEFERVKRIDTDREWLDDAEGKVVKMVSMLLLKLPPDRHYKIVFMKRRLEETLASQEVMLDRLNQKGGGVSRDKMKLLYEKHLAEVEAWLGRQPFTEVEYVSYNDALKSPAETAARLDRYFGGNLDREKMASVIDRSLYRQKADMLTSPTG